MTGWAAALVLAATLAACQATDPAALALTNATVVDGSGAPPRAEQVILIRDGHILAIKPMSEFVAAPRTREIDVAGKWVVPGLIDAHVHLEPWTLPRFLAHGVTTVRELHGGLEQTLARRARVNGGTVDGPRIFTAGAMLDVAPTTYPDALPVSDGPSARKAVDRLAVAGADLVKIYTRVTPSLLQVILDEARGFSFRVAAHLGLTDAVTAATLGVRSIEHLSGIPEAAGPKAALEAAHRAGFFRGWTAFERSWATLDSASLERVAKRLAERNVVLVPTLVLHETFARLDDTLITRQPALAEVPAAQQAAWNLPDLIRRAGWTPRDYAAFRASRPAQDRFVRLAFRAGVPIAAGSDAANQLLVPGESLIRELELLQAAGLSPMEALGAGTRVGARLLGADSLGIIAPGRVADLLILGADPTRDIGALRRVERVLLRGRPLDADSLRRAVTSK